MSITVLDPGLLTTIQDMGRRGYQQFGVPVSGAMDPRSANIANLLVGNSADEAVLECTLLGPQLVFEEANTIAITGGDFLPILDDNPIPMYCAIQVHAGQRLCLQAAKTGCRGYIAFFGGLDVPLVMGSRSTCIRAKIGGYEGRQLQKGDTIRFSRPGTPPNMAKRKLLPEFRPESIYTLRVTLGPQDDAFTAEGLQTFLKQTYTVTNTFDRMGYRLEGPIIQHKADGNIISDAIPYGGIQVPPVGKPIIMTADRQTTGGYTKIGSVITADFRLLGQLKGGDRVCFNRVTVEDAQYVLLSQAYAIEKIRRAIN